MTLPLVLLAIPSVLIGFLTISPMLFGDFFKDSIFVNSALHGAMQSLAAQYHGPVELALHGLTALPFWLALGGALSAYYLYIVNPGLPALIQGRVMPIFRLLENKYYMDWFNENVIAPGVRGLGRVFWRVGDQTLIDGAVVNGSWRLVGWVSSVARRLQTGYLYDYALVMILGVVILMTYFVWLK